MKRAMLIIMTLSILTLFSDLLPVTWEIKQDGTGDFTTISEGITAAQDGDTILVYPGIYYERINYQGKNITVTSLYDGDQFDESYIANTVIDGNHEGTVVIFAGNETRNTILNGFTVRHGYGNNDMLGPAHIGGGIFVYNASPVISYCIIEYNYAFMGGGIYHRNANALLKGNTIRYNHAIEWAGVLAGGTGNSNLEFCTISLNSVYLNYGGDGSDLFFGNQGEQSSIVIDTLTVVNPDKHFVSFAAGTDHSPPDFTVTVNHGKIEPVAADLYVSPDGCDTNSGLSPDEPLQNIALAIKMLDVDDSTQRTVHVAEGIYSSSLNDQKFPIALRDNVALIGADMATTILDGENEHPLIIIQSLSTYVGPYYNFAVKNFSLVNGGNPIRYYTIQVFRIEYGTDFEISNITVANCSVKGYRIVPLYIAGGESRIRNISIYDTMGSQAFYIYHARDEYDFYGENIRIRDHRAFEPPDPNYVSGTGIAMAINGHSGAPITENSRADIVNLEITNNHIDHVFPGWSSIPHGHLNVFNYGTIRIINATIGNNTSTNTYGGGITFNRRINHVHLINSIVYGNSPNNIVVRNDVIQQGHVYISNSLIEGGEGGVVYYSNPNTIVRWGEGNIDADPLWLGEVYPDYDGDYPYMLSEFSPARNAGTLNIPDFEFPEYDLAGNPRIYGNSIDMGAYEWNPGVGVENYDEVIPDLSIHDYKLHNYPNPVVNMKGMGRGKGVGTTISFVMPVEGEAVIDIYNLKGQFVRRLFNAFVQKGEYEVLWNGRDEQERLVSTGFYMYRLQINGETVATGRCTFVK